MPLTQTPGPGCVGEILAVRLGNLFTMGRFYCEVRFTYLRTHSFLHSFAHSLHTQP